MGSGIGAAEEAVETLVGAGEKVVMFYNSGNRDERVFENPYTFDVTRAPNPAQIGFGAGGPHFCLGSNLARLEIRLSLEEMTKRVKQIRIPERKDVEYVSSSFVRGLLKFPAILDPR